MKARTTSLSNGIQRLIFNSITTLGVGGMFFLAMRFLGSFSVRLESSSQQHQRDLFLQFMQYDTAAAVQNKSVNVQLSDVQIMWVADMLHLVHSINQRTPNLLVFGVGNDSPMWNQINCNGRTVFVEDDKDWIKTVLDNFPSLEIYHVEYHTSTNYAAEYFSHPVALSIDASVDAECFDVILIDGPKGYAPESPGRMIPAYYSSKRAKECKTPTAIFLHDSERPVEQTIIERFFSNREGWCNLGSVAGPFGTLTGWGLEFSQSL